MSEQRPRGGRGRASAGAIVAIVATGAIGAGAWWLGHRGGGVGQGGAPSSVASVGGGARPPLRCGLEPGNQLRFTLSSSSTYVVDPTAALGKVGNASGSAVRGRETLEGHLRWRVLESKGESKGESNGESNDGVRLVAADLGDASLTGTSDEGLQAALHHPALFRVDPRCRITELGTEHGLPASARTRWELTMKLVEMVTPDDPTAISWRLDQYDTTGTYRALYAVADHDGLAAITRRRQSYSSVRHAEGQAAPRAEILGSLATAEYAAGVPWFSAMRVDEHVALKVREAVVADVSVHLELASAKIDGDDAFWSRAFDPSAYDWGNADVVAQQPNGPSGLAYANRPPTPGLDKRTMASVLVDVDGLLKREPHDFDGATALLVEYLRLHPDEAARLVDDMRYGKIATSLRPTIFLALELCGGPAARDALAKALRDRSMAEADRVRAVAALKDVPTTDHVVVAAIRGVADEHATTLEDQSVRSSAILASGALVGKPGISADDRKGLIEDLTAHIKKPADPNDLVNYIDAAGNSHDRALAPVVSDQLGSADPAVRAACYRALSHMASLPDPVQLLDALAAAHDGNLVRAISDALVTDLGEPPQAEVDHAIALMPTMSNEMARATTIIIVGIAAKTNADAKAALIRQYHVEKQPHLLVLIGKYLSVEDLR